MVVTTTHKMDNSGDVKASEPIGIPTKRIDSTSSIGAVISPTNKAVNKNVARLVGDTKKSSDVKSPQSNEEDEEYIPPDGSPTFESVMNDIAKELSESHLQESPISPLALPNGLENMFKTSDVESNGSLGSANNSPAVTRRRAVSATSNGGRSRSYSWNHRNKMAAERRKQMQLQLPEGKSYSKSAQNTPMLKRNKKASQSTPKVLHVIPKFKFLTETVSVSHEDLVKEQERERLLQEGFAESKSIFDNEVYQRFGATPTP